MEHTRRLGFAEWTTVASTVPESARSFKGLEGSDVVAYELYRVPLRWAYIPGIATRPNVPPIQAKSAVFGPVIERVVSGYGMEAGNQGLDFESGAQSSIPERELHNNDLRRKWVVEHGVDLLVVDKGGFKWNLVGPDFRVAQLSEGQWDQATPEELRRALDTAVMDSEDGWPFHGINDPLEKPLTFALQTSNGTMGLLQITGFTENPRGVKIRYKLVQTSGQTARPEDLSEADRARAVALFNDIEDFGHEFDAAFTAKNLPAAQTGTRRLLTLLTNFNAAVKGTDCEFPPGIFDDIAKLRQALDEGDWDKIQQAARHNEDYARAFKRIGSRMVELARQQKQGASSR